MSILIKGLKAPKDDESMILVLVREETIDCYDGYGTKIAEAVELPENHGDLVDMDYIKNHWPNVQHFGAPVVIPAERSDDGGEEH